jgi:hypothetical protein
MSLENLEECMQLHEHVEIHYYVDHYEVQLWRHDGNNIVMVGRGPTIIEALCMLEKGLTGWTLEKIRNFR